MSGLFNFSKKIFSKKTQIPAGIYHYQSPSDDSANTRYHLRMEDTGDGILIINASTVLHLNQTAASYVYYMIQNTSAGQVGKEMAARYQVHPERRCRIIFLWQNASER